MNSPLSWNIIHHFSRNNTYGFGLNDVKRAFPQKNFTYLARTLSEMVRTGLLYKVNHNNYHIIPFNSDPENYAPDVNQVAKYFMGSRPHYIGYTSALLIHSPGNNLDDTGIGMSKSEEPKSEESTPGGFAPKESTPGGFAPKESTPGGSNHTVTVVTGKQIKPAVRNLGGTEYHFIHHNPTRFFGFDSIWINKYEKAMVSDLEKTIVDIATAPRYCKGITGLGHALIQMNERLNKDTLFHYFTRNMNKSGKKRYLFITDLLGLEWSNMHESMLEEIGTGISLLDPVSADQGKIVKRYGIKLNVDPGYIKKMAFEMAKGND